MNTVASASSVSSILAALLVPLVMPETANAQLSASPIPVIHCSELPTYIRTAPPKTIVQITGTCTNLELKGRKEPILIIAGTARRPSATIVGLRLVNLGSDVVWQGGIIEAPKGRAGVSREGYAISCEGGSCSVEGATITNARVGFSTPVPRGHVRLVNNIFAGLRSDGINFAGLPNSPLTATITGNVFRDFRPELATCTLPDGTVESPTVRSRCIERGGAWRDGDHPDCIQFWGNVTGAIISHNRIENATNCQGITSFGRSFDRYSNVRVTNNEVHVTGPNGIVIGNCADCEVTNNRVRGPDAYIRTYGEVPGLVLCGNTIETNHPTKTLSSGVWRCDAY